MTKPTDPHDPASPCPDAGREEFNSAAAYPGLTKREHFAALAMQGILAGDAFNGVLKAAEGRVDGGFAVAVAAVGQADALIAALNAKP